MKKAPEERARIETPSLPPMQIPPAGTPPDRPHPAPGKQKRAGRAATADPCASLTNAAIQAVIDKIIESRDKAVSDDAKNGSSALAPGAWANAASYNLASLTEARDKMTVLRDWLHTAGVLDPPPFVSNITGAYNVHGYVRETVISLHSARHWATISATYHQSADARNSYELTTQALDLIEPLGAQAGRCYMAPYGPFS